MNEPSKLKEQRWQEGDVPLLTICCTTYNHERFIADALEGFLLQQTTFRIKIRIHDDASSDATPAILRNYQAKYPGIFDVLYQQENQFSKGVRVGMTLMTSCDTKYVAFCEGDDYWTDCGKLQKQVDYLESHPEVELTFHDVVGVDSNKNVLYPSKIGQFCYADQPKCLRTYEQISKAMIPTLSIVYRSVKLKPLPTKRQFMNGDNYLFAMLSEFGEMHMLDGQMGHYRIHGGGIWSSQALSNRPYENLKTEVAILRDICLANTRTAARNLYLDIIWLFSSRAIKGDFRHLQILSWAYFSGFKKIHLLLKEHGVASFNSVFYLLYAMVLLPFVVCISACFRVSKRKLLKLLRRSGQV